MEKEKVKKSFYTNGVKTIKLEEGEPIPEGYWKGRTFNCKPWNKGLSKENDERVKLASEKTSLSLKGNTPWNKGLTKENNQSLKTVSEKVSKAKKGKPGPNKNKPMSNEAKAKLSRTRKEKYASGEIVCWCKGQTKETNSSLKSASEKQMGHSCYVKDWEVAKKKEYETKKRNHTMNSSKVEDNYYLYLCEQYGCEDVVRQYVSELYPFPCDFYIKSQRLYIEINFAPEYGCHPFNKEDKDDLELVEMWREKYNNTNSKRYLNMIYIFTERDPLKLKTFREHNLNFKIIYKNNLIIEK